MAEQLIIFAAQYLVVLSLVVFVGYSFTLQGGKRSHLYLLAVMSLAVAYGAAKLLSIAYFDPRPFVSDGVIPLLPHAPTNGMPSGHVVFGATLAMVACLFNWRVGAALWTIALLVGAARIMAGVHHVIDIAGSVAIAIAAAWAIERLLVYWQRSH